MKVIDSHTGGEPTRVIYDGGPPLGNGSLSERLEVFRRSFDEFRQAAILEPRGSEAMVGALLCEPTNEGCITGIIFFNNKGYLGMCGHGMIGVAATLFYQGKIGLGEHLVETPVGVVKVNLISPNKVSVENVPSYCYRQNVDLNVDGFGSVKGDIAWGGNWFFLCNVPLALKIDNLSVLKHAAEVIRRALLEQGVTGNDGAEIDHIEFFSEPVLADADCRNFVLCPGGEYDRSPCGTGTSAKLACLAKNGELASGQVWVQESVIGSRFSAHYRHGNDDTIIPTIVGHAYICGESTLIQHPQDPFKHGISS
jgi:4-hydroxyproline epimerase